MGLLIDIDEKQPGAAPTEQAPIFFKPQEPPPPEVVEAAMRAGTPKNISLYQQATADPAQKFVGYGGKLEQLQRRQFRISPDDPTASALARLSRPEPSELAGLTASEQRALVARTQAEFRGLLQRYNLQGGGLEEELKNTFRAQQESELYRFVAGRARPGLGETALRTGLQLVQAAGAPGEFMAKNVIGQVSEAFHGRFTPTTAEAQAAFESLPAPVRIAAPFLIAPPEIGLFPVVNVTKLVGRGALALDTAGPVGAARYLGDVAGGLGAAGKGLGEATATVAGSAKAKAGEIKAKVGEIFVDPRFLGMAKPPVVAGEEAAAARLSSLATQSVRPVGTALEIAKEYNAKSWYHGTGTKGLTAETLDPFAGSHESLFGQGVYLTDSPEIARGYAGARGAKTGERLVYKAKVNLSAVLDLESPVTPDILKAIKSAVEIPLEDLGGTKGLLDAAAAKPGATVEDIIRAFRTEVSIVSHQEFIRTSEFVELLQEVAIKLKQAGYDALTYTGGKRTARAPHRVLVLLDPQDLYSGTGRAQQIVEFGLQAAKAPVAPAAETVGGEMSAALAAGKAPWEATVAKMATIFAQAKPARQVTELLYTAERAKRLAESEAFRLGGATTAEAERAARSALTGQLPQAEIIIPKGITPEDVVALHDRARAFEGYEHGFKWHHVTDALGKLFANPEGVRLPSPSEFKLLEQVFGSEFVQPLLKLRPMSQKARDAFWDLVNLPRTVKASFDESFPLRQGIMLAPGHPREFGEAVGNMFRAAVSEKGTMALDAATRADKFFPLFTFRRNMDLAYLPVKGTAAQLTEREELFMSRLLQQVTPFKQTVGIGLRVAERGYVTMGNQLRYSVLRRQVLSWQQQGLGEAEVLRYGREYARFLNFASGRGPLGPLAPYAHVLGAAFFAPRLAISRYAATLYVANPGMSAQARQLVARDLVAFYGSGMSVLTILKASGVANVEIDPRSTDFGKIRIGNTRLDFWGGHQTVVRNMYQIVTASMKSQAGVVTEIGRKGQAVQFLRSKLSPVAGGLWDVTTGENFIGQEVATGKAAVPQQLQNNFTPLFWQDLVDAMKEDGLVGGFASIPSFFGAGVTAYHTAQDVKDAASRNMGLGDNFESLSYSDKQKVENDPEVRKALKGMESEFQRERIASEVGLEQRFGDTLREAIYTDGIKEFREAWKTVQRAFAIEAEHEFAHARGAVSPERQALVDYYRVLDDAKIKAGEVVIGIDFDYVEKRRAYLEAGWTPKQREFVENNTAGGYHPPRMQEYVNFQRSLRTKGWYSLGFTTDLYTKAEPINQRLMQEWRVFKGSVKDFAEYWVGLYPEDTRPSAVLWAEAFDKAQGKAQDELRRNDPALDLGFARFHGLVPKTYDTLAVQAQELQRSGRPGAQIGVLLNINDGSHIENDFAAALEQAGYTLERLAASTPSEIAAYLKRSDIPNPPSADSVRRRGWIETARIVLELMHGSR